jgi:hypothetical protein
MADIMVQRVYLNIIGFYLTNFTNILFIIWGLDIQMKYGPHAQVRT